MEIVEIFTLMNWVPAVLLVLGFVMIVAEVFIPGFGFFGVAGILSLIAGIIVRIVQGLNLTQSIMLILMALAFLIVAGLVMIFSARFGVLSHTGLFENKTAIPTDYNRVDRQLRKLIGKSGRTISVLALGGKAKIAGKIYDVVSMGSYIEAGRHIRVVEIKDNTIMVRKWFE